MIFLWLFDALAGKKQKQKTIREFLQMECSQHLQFTLKLENMTVWEAHPVSRLGASIDTIMATGMNETDLCSHRFRGFWKC